MLELLCGKPEHEILQKALRIALDCLVEHAGLDPVKCGEVRVEQDLAPPNKKNPGLDAFGCGLGAAEHQTIL